MRGRRPALFRPDRRRSLRVPPTDAPVVLDSAPPEPSDRTASSVPGAKAVAWAVVGLAALRKRKDQSATLRARVDPFRTRPPRTVAPDTDERAALVARGDRAPTRPR